MMMIPVTKIVATDDEGVERVWEGKGSLLINDTVVADDEEKLSAVRFITVNLVPKQESSNG